MACGLAVGLPPQVVGGVIQPQPVGDLLADVVDAAVMRADPPGAAIDGLVFAAEYLPFDASDHFWAVLVACGVSIAFQVHPQVLGALGPFRRVAGLLGGLLLLAFHLEACLFGAVADLVLDAHAVSVTSSR